MKKTLFIILFLVTSVMFSQRKYAKEFRLLSDNDFYTSFYYDRYYSNGMFFSYRFLGENKNPKIEKKIFQVQLGHSIYTPYKPTVLIKEQHDRPFAGLLLGSFGMNTFYTNESVFKYDISLGVIGPNAFGYELQKFIHDMYGFRDAMGWKYQISNALAFNGRVTYIKPLVKNASFTNDINWVNSLNIGTVFADISTGFYSRIGLISLQKNSNSITFGGNLNNSTTNFNNEKEAFLFIKPMLSYVLYDATIQGSFLNKESPVIYLVMPFQFSLETGIKFTVNKFHFGYSIHYHTKKLKSNKVPKSNVYGSIVISYQFN